MAGRDKSSTTVDSNKSLNGDSGFFSKFKSTLKSDWDMFKGLPDRYKTQGKDIGKTADTFLKDFGGGSFGKGAAKLGGYGIGGAMIWDMLFD